jgi:hypothetical protein
MNYATLVSNIQNFVEDDSTELSNSIDQIISQAEEMVFQRLPSLPCFRQIRTNNFVVGEADVVIPSARMVRQFSVTDSQEGQAVSRRRFGRRRGRHTSRLSGPDG